MEKRRIHFGWRYRRQRFPDVFIEGQRVEVGGGLDVDVDQKRRSPTNGLTMTNPDNF